jgi:hypothetical protein
MASGLSARVRIVAAAVLIAALAMMSRSMLLYMPIWLFGFVVMYVPTSSLVSRHSKLFFLAAVAMFVACVCCCHTSWLKGLAGNSALLIDYVTGVSFMGVLWVALHDLAPSAGTFYAEVSRRLSDMSYTLYVMHMPLLVFLRAAIVPDAPWVFQMSTFIWFAALAAACLAYAWCLAQLTEANTARVRGLLAARVPPQAQLAG